MLFQGEMKRIREVCRKEKQQHTCKDERSVITCHPGMLMMLMIIVIIMIIVIFPAFVYDREENKLA